MDTKFCPHCKRINPKDAIICEHCREPFEPVSDKNSTTLDVDRKTKIFQEDLAGKIEMGRREPPAEGLAIYLAKHPQPIAICLEKEFVIGRLTEATNENVVDLSAYKAFDLGVSRRHATIRRAGKGYNIIDLNSSNGTWVNERILPPLQPTPLKSGSQIRLGQMQIYVVFRE